MNDPTRRKVNVLLSTYNGERYLPELLESLHEQSHPAECITIRDDGSTNNTREFVRGFAASRSDVKLITGDRIGVTQSFFALLEGADKGCDYFAFCDQDDVWRPSKLQHAVEMLESSSPEQPVLYCSAIEYVDANLSHLAYSKEPRILGFANALVENVATGCTIVLNRRARTLLVNHPWHAPLMHDWWCYLVVSAFGSILYDARPNVRYRLHRNNTVGAALGPWRQFRRRLARFWSTGLIDPKFREQAQMFFQYFGPSLGPPERRTLEEFLCAKQNAWSRFAYAVRMKPERQSMADMAILRLLVALGRV